MTQPPMPTDPELELTRQYADMRGHHDGRRLALTIVAAKAYRQAAHEEIQRAGLCRCSNGELKPGPEPDVQVVEVDGPALRGEVGRILDGIGARTRARQEATEVAEPKPGPMRPGPFGHCHEFVGVGWCHRAKGHGGKCSTSSKDDQPADEPFVEVLQAPEEPDQIDDASNAKLAEAEEAHAAYMTAYMNTAGYPAETPEQRTKQPCRDAACALMHCARCNHHSGNLGHLTTDCKATGDPTATAHMCCPEPAGCERNPF